MSKSSANATKKPLKAKPSSFKKILKILFVLFLIIVCLVIIVNIALYFVYKNKTYPKTTLNNQTVGSIAFLNLNDKTKTIISLPDEITLKVKEKSQAIKPADLGLSVNYSQINKNIIHNRSKIPFLNLFITKDNNAAYELDEPKTKEKLESLRSALEQSPSGAYIKLENQKFIIVPATALVSLDLDKATPAIKDQLAKKNTEITLPHNEVNPPESSNDLTKESEKLNKSLTTDIVVKYGGQSKQLSANDIASFYVAKDKSYVISTQNISKKVDELAKQFGIIAGNKSEITKQISEATLSNKNTTVTLTEAPAKKINYTYCVAAKGVDESYLGAFRSKLASVYADPKGWGLNGQITFSPTSGGCSFTAWLTAADLVPSFSSTICDNIWSCRVGNNVIINFDRWSGASPAWNGAGGSLDSYRSMVINHETGHWLGFHHRFCGGGGQTAPVMQQQSISLQGCNFNSWPTASELQSLKLSKGL